VRAALTGDPTGETPVRKYYFGGKEEEDVWNEDPAARELYATPDCTVYEEDTLYGKDIGKKLRKDWLVKEIIHGKLRSGTAGFVRLAPPVVKWDEDEAKWETKTTSRQSSFFVGQQAFTKSRDLDGSKGGWYVAKIDQDTGTLHLAPPRGLSDGEMHARAHAPHPPLIERR
jgi:hypothetical protein